MPKVGKKHFPYTKEGKEEAKEMSKKTGKKVLSKSQARRMAIQSTSNGYMKK